MDRAVPHRPGNNTAFRRPRNYPYRINDLRPGKDTTMRKPRNYDAELKALEDKAKELKTRKVQQLGELVIATGADALTADELAGALVALAETKDAGKREAWAKRGAAFFQGRSRRSAPASEHDSGGAQTQPGSAQSSSGATGAA
ncbi:conjugal transfer protein TraD [Paracoccus sp. SSJ]|uniref:conjugal transfer protein TraD n=1 Tax=Paracoccus sp. SSJ TaxID=3050636 RepID=UPI00254DFB6D|nr:conjugal transfer protein TraD [Paracoccus sp. SSJ]MDK8875096.1 conjugal transfer protein TraD [Paracoccus sp. SSJ]